MAKYKYDLKGRLFSHDENIVIKAYKRQLAFNVNMAKVIFLRLERIISHLLVQFFYHCTKQLEGKTYWTCQDD